MTRWAAYNPRKRPIVKIQLVPQRSAGESGNVSVKMECVREIAAMGTYRFGVNVYCPANSKSSPCRAKTETANATEQVYDVGSLSLIADIGAKRGHSVTTYRASLESCEQSEVFFDQTRFGYR